MVGVTLTVVPCLAEEAHRIILQPLLGGLFSGLLSTSNILIQSMAILTMSFLSRLKIINLGMNHIIVFFQTSKGDC